MEGLGFRGEGFRVLGVGFRVQVLQSAPLQCSGFVFLRGPQGVSLQGSWKGYQTGYIQGFRA